MGLIRMWVAHVVLTVLPPPLALADSVGLLQVHRHACYAVLDTKKASSQAGTQELTSIKQVLSTIIHHHALAKLLPY